jgi:amino acid permease
MKKLFTLPTWQIFLLLIIPCFFTSVTLVGTIITVIWAVVIAYCIYLLGNSLYQKLPIGHDLKVKQFHFNLLFPLVYLTIVLILFDGGYEINQNNYNEFGWWLVVIIPLHLYTMYCMFYTIWFIAKCIATIENNRVVEFDSYAGNFFLLWFFPIGIWFIHPKVRKIFSMDAETRPMV